MKKLLTIAATLLLCACGEKYTGLGSVDLRVTSITFSDSDPATITGTLPSGKPADFILAVDAPQVKGITVRFSPQADTAGLAEANNTVSFPLFADLQTQQSDGIAEFELLHAGLSWIPDYSLREETGTRKIYATALLNNTTAQTWRTDTVRLVDPENNSVTTATGRITIRPGTHPVPWWDAAAGVPEAVISYGWPIRGRWNPMIAVYCPAAGRVESWTGSIYCKNDTLWFPADSLIELHLTWQQMPTEYRCFMEAISLTDSTMHWRIQWPERLPRGADIDPGIESFELSSGEAITIMYREIY
ncbi:MAG: hypothetical protein KAR40_05960 [Candidatus Sabulitectum sp.]|nr:hypothetical protein [Candidatus Sabulitectum sp.]